MSNPSYEYTDIDSGKVYSPQRRKTIIIAVTISIVVVIIVLISVGLAIKFSNGDDENNTPTPTPNPTTLEEAMSLDHLLGHLENFEIIANAHNGSRAVQFGYNASAEYVVQRLNSSTDFIIWTQPFQVEIFEYVEPSALAQVSPEMEIYEENVDWMQLNGFAGEVNKNYSVLYAFSFGCNGSDYNTSNISPGFVALVMRGNCTFREKALVSNSVGASALLIYNDGTSSSRMGPFTGSLGGPVPIPVFGISYFLGMSLSEVPGLLLNIQMHSTATNMTTMNVFAETPFGNPENVIVVGSHLDSVPAGPGINDNGSGSSTNLELAIQLAQLNLTTTNQILFAWWGAEEIGLLGSTYFIENLNATDPVFLSSLALNINLDMVASPNYMIGIYNGSGAGDAIVQPCIKIQNLFEEAFATKNISFMLTPFSGRSDYGPFIEVDIPAGGLFTGAEEIKSMEERVLFGGIANAAFDPCYHLSCDNLYNINNKALLNMAQASARVLENLAMQPNLTDFLFSA